MDACPIIFVIEFSQHRRFLTFALRAALFSGLLTRKVVTGMRLCSAGWGGATGMWGLGAGGLETGNFCMVLEQLHWGV